MAMAAANSGPIAPSCAMIEIRLSACFQTMTRYANAGNSEPLRLCLAQVSNQFK
jgi:hypothetical protein